MAPPRNSFAERLGKDFAPLYVISGDEHLLVTETADAIRAQARNRGFTDRKVFTFDSAASFKWANVHREAASMSLFGDKPFIEVIFRTTRLGRDGAKEIGAFLEAVSPDSAAMFVFPRFDAAAGKTAWAKELKDKTVFIPISPVTREQLPAWITERLKQQNQKITPEAATFMCEHVEGNLLAAHQEILKLGLLFPEGELSLENVSSSVMNVSRFDVFQTTEALLAGDAARYAKIITALKAEDAPAPLILWLIAEEIRTLIRYSDAVKNGENTFALKKRLKIWGAREKFIDRAAGRLPRRVLENALRETANIDRLVKGLKNTPVSPDVWDAIISLGLTLTKRN